MVGFGDRDFADQRIAEEIGLVVDAVVVAVVTLGVVILDVAAGGGRRDDPFFIDLEQFFRIIPDRRPVSGPLSQLPATPSASSFRAAGQALDYVRGFNDMAIVIELPVSMLERDPSHPSSFGVWGTTSRARSN